MHEQVFDLLRFMPQVQVIIQFEMKNPIDKFKIHEDNRHKFAIGIIILEVIIVILYGIFVRVTPHDKAYVNQAYYPTYIKRHSYGRHQFTLFLSMLSQFSCIYCYNHSGFVYSKGTGVRKNWTLASYSVASTLIAFGGVLGKVGPFELLVMSIFGIVGYTLNQQLVYSVLKTFDVGGSTAIHTYGAYFGLSVSFILSKKCKPSVAAQTSYGNIIYSLIGTLFLWMYWPSFNTGYFPENGFQRSLIISNTIISLTGSCLSTLVATSLFRKKFNMEDILNASLAGGVIIGAPSGVVVNSGVSLTIGIIGGLVSSIGYRFLLQRIEHSKLGLHDTCGINNLHGIPGILGGLVSAMVIASYQTYPGLDEQYQPYLNLKLQGRTYSEQAGIQVGATFMSLGIGIVFGLLAGLAIYKFYHFDANDLFDDSYYFELPHEDQKHEIPDSSARNANKNQNLFDPLSLSNSQLDRKQVVGM